MSEESKNNEPQQQPTQPADNGKGTGEKMFTQEELNRIVSDRLARDRESRSTQQQNEEKELALKARESRFDCREFVAEQNYPVELLDILDTSDVDKFKKMVEELSNLFGYRNARFAEPPKFTGIKGQRVILDNDPIRDAFKAKD